MIVSWFVLLRFDGGVLLRGVVVNAPWRLKQTKPSCLESEDEVKFCNGF